MKILGFSLTFVMLCSSALAGPLKAYVSVRKNTCHSSCISVPWDLPDDESNIEINPWAQTSSQDEVSRIGKIKGQEYKLSVRVKDHFELNKRPYSAFHLKFVESGIEIFKMDFKVHSEPAFNYSSISTQRVPLPDGGYSYLTITFWE